MDMWLRVLGRTAAILLGLLLFITCLLYDRPIRDTDRARLPPSLPAPPS
jgi:uncharacterized membrane protein